jgi:signal transduction histidine kinase
MFPFLRRKEEIQLRTLKLWERLFEKKQSGLTRTLISFMVGTLGFSAITILYNKTGNYFNSITIFTSILIALFGGFAQSLILTATTALLADYFYITPIGSVLTDIKSLEHFLIANAIGLIINCLVSTLRYSFHQMILAKHEAERGSAAMEKILALVSHDIRNPLTACKMSAGLIFRLSAKSGQNQHLAVRIIDGLNRADSMIQALLDVSRIRAGNGIALKFEYCDLTAIVVQTVEDLAAIYGNRFSLVKSQTILGTWSPDGIRRALENLATNAVKYGSSSTPIVIQVTQKSDTATLSIHNDGKEIEVADQPKLFDSFYRTNIAQQGSEKGWGLGLELVKGIVDAHFGTITVDSRNGFGTTFSLKLPIRSISKSKEDPKPSLPPLYN